MTYQRGTDLKHCPDGCPFFSSTRVCRRHYVGADNLLCCVRVSDTCPREQAEQPANHHCDKCRAETCSMCVYATGEWKERTNG